MAAPPGSFSTSGPGLPPHGAVTVAHSMGYRVALGLGLDGYQQALDESYRQSTHPVAVQQPLIHAPAVAPPTGPAPGQFGILAPTSVPVPVAVSVAVPVPVPDVGPHATGPPLFAPDPDSLALQHVVDRPHGQLNGRIVPNPPDLHEWREKLFNVDETIVLTDDQ